MDRAHDRLMRIVMTRRARLGIKVNLQARATDSIGAYVDGVTPGGPAAKAGLERATSSRSWTAPRCSRAGRRGGARQRASLPGLRLIELAARLEPNDTVPVDYRRGKDRQTVRW